MASTLYKYGMKLTPKGSHQLEIRKPKLELGTVATDWSPAPEDPDSDLLERINVLQTDFQGVQGQIQAKVWETDIEKATDGLYESINEMYAYINETIDGISAEVGDLTYTVNENYYSLTEQISDLVITADDITASVRDVEQTMETYYNELTGEIIGYYNTTMELIASIQIEADSITSTVADIQTTIDGIINPANILLYTRDMDMTAPWRDADSETDRITSWRIYSDDTLPAGSAYARARANSGTSSGNGNFRGGGFHWSADDDIIYDNLSRLVEGEVYTFSFYMHPDETENYYIWINNCLYGQTILDSNYTIHTDGYSPFGTNYILIPPGDTDSWVRVSISFKLDDINNLRIGLFYGIETTALPYIYICGLMLSAGSTLYNWDDGTSTYFATTDYVYSQIEQLANSIKLEVKSSSNGSASIVMTVNGDDAGGDTLYSKGLRNAFAEDDTSAITISAGTITFNSNTFICNSSYFSVTAAGVITATRGTIAGWTIGGNYLYDGPTSLSDTTAGTILNANASGGIRNNGDERGILIQNGQLRFYWGSTQVGSLVAGSATGLTLSASDLTLSGKIKILGTIEGPYQNEYTSKQTLSGQVRAVAYYNSSTGTTYWIYLTFWGGLLQEVSTSYSGAWTEYSLT